MSLFHTIQQGRCLGTRNLPTGHTPTPSHQNEHVAIDQQPWLQWLHKSTCKVLFQIIRQDFYFLQKLSLDMTTYLNKPILMKKSKCIVTKFMSPHNMTGKVWSVGPRMCKTTFLCVSWIFQDEIFIKHS